MVRSYVCHPAVAERNVPVSNHPPVELASLDRSVDIVVNAHGQPVELALSEAVRSRSGELLARQIMSMYGHAVTVAQAAENMRHFEITGTWMSDMPGPAHVDAIRLEF